MVRVRKFRLKSKMQAKEAAKRKQLLDEQGLKGPNKRSKKYTHTIGRPQSHRSKEQLATLWQTLVGWKKFYFMTG